MRDFLRRMRQRALLTCEDVNHFLAEYLEGALDEGVRERFEKHLVGCAQCQEYLKQYRTTVDLVREAEEAPSPPEELIEKTLAFLRKHH